MKPVIVNTTAHLNTGARARIKNFAPPGTYFRIQCIEPLSAEEAVEWALKIIRVPKESLRLVPGHFDTCNGISERKGYSKEGWMLFSTQPLKLEGAYHNPH